MVPIIIVVGAIRPAPGCSEMTKTRGFPPGPGLPLDLWHRVYGLLLPGGAQQREEGASREGRVSLGGLIFRGPFLALSGGRYDRNSH
jgi:hypothetical protein